MEPKDLRLAMLRRFAAAITLLNLAGHTFLGFEPSWAQPFAGLLAAYSTELLLETIEARRLGRRPRFLGPGTAFVDFLLPAHITGLAVAMLLYPGERLAPIAFAAATAIASKYVFRVQTNGAVRHVFNPSNFGISATLLAFPWVGIGQPYMFTENLSAFGSWFLPGLIICAGTLLNLKLTKRIPLIVTWLGAFVLQAAARHFLFGNLFLASLNPMTGVAFLLFTFYMLTDPATTPRSPGGQVAFSLAVAAVYGLLMALHLVFDLFFALTAVCAGRGALLYFEGLASPASRPGPSSPRPSSPGLPPFRREKREWLV
jgi:hypothetical protein